MLPIFQPAECPENTANAIRAVSKGNASPEQMKAALLWIMDDASGMWTDPMSVQGRDGIADYMNGRRSVALQIAAVLRRAPSKAKETL